MNLAEAKRFRLNQRVTFRTKSGTDRDVLGGVTQDLVDVGTVWAAVRSSAFSKFATTYQAMQIINPHGVDVVVRITSIINLNTISEADVVIYNGIEHDIKFITDIDEKNEYLYIFAEKGVIKTQDVVL